MLDYILAAQHEQSEWYYFVNETDITWSDLEECSNFFAEHPDSRAYGYVSF